MKSQDCQKIAWDEIANHAESEEYLHLSVLEAQQKLRDFIGDKICIDYGGCDNYCLGGWNDNLFGIDKMDQFDFGQTVNFGHRNVQSIFGPIIQPGNIGLTWGHFSDCDD